MRRPARPARRFHGAHSGRRFRAHSGRRFRQIKRGKFFATERATELLEKVEATGRRAPLRQLARLERLLACPCCGVRLKAVRWRYVLESETYAEVVKAYRKRFRGGS